MEKEIVCCINCVNRPSEIEGAISIHICSTFVPSRIASLIRPISKPLLNSADESRPGISWPVLAGLKAEKCGRGCSHVNHTAMGIIFGVLVVVSVLASDASSRWKGLMQFNDFTLVFWQQEQTLSQESSVPAALYKHRERDKLQNTFSFVPTALQNYPVFSDK